MNFDKFQQGQSYQSVGLAGAGTRADSNAGLRDHFLRVYRYLGVGVGITGLVTYLLTVNPEILFSVMGNGVMPWVFALLPLGFFLLIGFRFQQMSMGTMTVLFGLFAVSMAFPTAVLTYFASATGHDAAIARAFLATAVTFGAMSLYGYTTKKDLSGMAAFLFVGMVGVILTAILNGLVFQSSTLMLVLSIVTVLIFAGLIAFDTQKIRVMYLEASTYSDAVTLNKLALVGAAELYFDVVAIFRQLLFLFMSTDD